MDYNTRVTNEAEKFYYDYIEFEKKLNKPSKWNRSEKGYIKKIANDLKRSVLLLNNDRKATKKIPKISSTDRSRKYREFLKNKSIDMDNKMNEIFLANQILVSKILRLKKTNLLLKCFISNSH